MTPSRKRVDRRMDTPEYFVKRMDRLMQDPTNRQLWREHLGYIGPEEWNSQRNLVVHYDPLFGYALHKVGLGNTLAKAFASIPRKPREPLEIVEDGPGEGIFLSELKRELNAHGIPNKTTAIGLHHQEELKQLQREGKIDESFHEFGELHVPKKTAHVVISLFGTLNYTLPVLRKFVLLKQAYSLKKGGLLLVGFGTPERYTPDTPEMYKHKSLSGKPELPKGVSMVQEMRGIEKSFEKRGFFAKFVPIPSAIYEPLQLPNWVLVVKRLH